MTRSVRAGVVVTVVAVLTAAGLVLAGRLGGGVGTPSFAGSTPSSAPSGTPAPTSPGEGPPDARLPAVDHAALVAGVHEEALGTIPPVRLAAGLVPPTNRWFSGLVFGEQPQPVFPRPLSVAITPEGFGVGLADPVTTERAIVAPHVPAVTVGLGAASSRVSDYDDASVTVDLLDGSGEPLASLVVAQGSPFVSLTARVDVTASTSGVFEASEVPGGGTAAYGTLASEGRTWAVVASGGTLDGSTLTIPAGASASFYALPADAQPRALEVLARAGADPVVGTRASYGVGDGVARTTIAYATASGAPTAFVTMPHHRTGQQPQRDGCGLGSYPSVYGTLDLCSGSQLDSFAPLREPARTLDVSGLTDEQRDVVVDQLASDVAATPDAPSDTYFGGKWLYRAATLVTLGEELGAADAVAGLREKATAALVEWTEPRGCAERDHRCFAYDPNARGVVGLTPSFGSEEFNDHHFHYGYHLAAAGMLAADDPELVATLAPVMNVLAQDIAAATASQHFPRMRNFDVYMGHSWASGTAPFADGNNQESSSEAVNAWNGLGLWARASGQTDLETEAAYLMSTETAAITYWTDLDLTDPVYAGYGRTIVTLNWGGKRDYATWFSAEPNAMLGILLIPMGPFADYLAIDAERIRASVAEAAPDGYGVQFGDYLLMYLALAGPDDAATAWKEATSLPDTSIDDGNSRAYLLAWIAAHM